MENSVSGFLFGARFMLGFDGYILGWITKLISIHLDWITKLLSVYLGGKTKYKWIDISFQT